MIQRSKIKKMVLALAGAALAGVLGSAAPAEAGHRYGYGYAPSRTVVVHRHVVRRPVVERVVYVHRPVVYRPRPVVRRVVVVHRPYRHRVHYGYGYGHRVGYRPGWRHHDRPRCWLPERHLCR